MTGIGGGGFDFDLRPVRIQFFGNQGCEAGIDTLA